MVKNSLLLKAQKPSFTDVVEAMAIAFLLALVLVAIAAVGTMIIFNIIHFNVAALSGVPAFGYWDSFVLTYAVSWLGFLFNGPRNK